MVMTKCFPEYWDFVRTLRMDPRVQHGFIEKADITIEQQIEYMHKHWKEYFICLIDDKPVGFVGSVNKDIRICTLPEYQGKGIGKFMLEFIMTVFPESYGKVKTDNEASKQLFLSCGFKDNFIIYTK